MAFFRKFLLLATAALLVGAAGCAYMPWNEAARSIANSKQLRVGMTKNEVLEVMGSPVSDETFSTPDVWYYFVQSVWMDGLTTEDECMPLVFEDGKLIGWGNPFYTHYRIEKKKGGKKLEL
jgi:outer membrane protein assembly factor BamE (lipoprotein component of BamABCDE complex)